MSAQPVGSHGAALLGGAAVVVTVVVAVTGALATSTPAILLAVPALFVAAALGALAVWRFGLFVCSLIALRSSLDLAKSAGGGTPLTEPAGLVALLMIGATVLWLATQWLMGVRRPLTATTAGIALFTTAALISITGAAVPLAALGVTLRLVAGLLMFVAVDHLLATGMPLRQITVALLAATIVPVLLPPLAHPFGVDFVQIKEGAVVALTSTFVLSNNFGHFLVPVVVIGAAARRSIPRRWRPAVTGLLAIAGVELVLAQTRGAWLAAVIGLAVVGLRRTRALGAAVLLAALLCTVVLPPVTQRLSSLASDPDQPRSESSWSWRLGHWRAIIPRADDHVLTGIGAGMTREVTPNHKEPHNDYVLAYVETGLLGLGAYLLLLTGFVSTAWRALACARDPLERALAPGIFAYAVGFAVASAGENLICGVTVLWYVLPLAAIANWIVHRPAATADSSTPTRHGAGVPA